MKLNQKTLSFLYKAGLLLAVIALVMACSRKKDTWINRNFHAMGTYYNILYNGNLALDNGQEQLNQNYDDDYWHILPVERMEDRSDPIQYGESSLESIREAENKEKSKDRSKSRGRKSNKLKNDAFPQNTPSGFGGDNNNQSRSGNNNRGNRNNNQMGRGGQNTGRGNQGRNSGNNMNAPGGLGNQSGNRGNTGRNNSGGRGQGGRGNMSGNTPQGGFGGQPGNRGNNAGNMNQSFGSQSRSLSRSSNNSGQQMGRNPSMGGGMSDVPGGQDSNASFERAETKAAKAIQKHNMLIYGEEHNPQMDEAFLLLGKARYYDQRYFPSLEAFNYILNKYKDSDRRTTARIWAEKTYMRLGNNERVLNNLQELLNEDTEFEDEDITEATTAIAQTYLNMDEKEKAIKPLNTAIRYTDDKAKKGRYFFIKGQIFERLNQIDSAKAAFNDVIALNRRSPRVYMINAYMEKAKIFDLERGNHAAHRDTLNTLLNDRENRPFLDIINYQIAQYYKKTDSMPKAIGYYNKSLRTNTPNHGLKARIYKTLGNYNFDEAQYKTAGAYYDSTMVNLPEASREFRDIRRKRQNLNDVIKYEDIAVKNDSILHLVNMPPAERQAYFTNYADSLKTLAITQAEQAEKDAKKSRRAANMFGTQKSQAGGGQSAGGSFYFYDQNQVSFGEQAFKKIWGNRELQDNWRTEASRSSGSAKEEEEAEEEVDYMAEIESNPAFKAETYLQQVPQDKNVIDSISDERNFAYYQLGVIYKEKFKEYKLASDKLENLLRNDPEERLILPSKYNLYKIYKIQENSTEANKWKQDILTNHPDSRYAQILRNPRSLRDEKNSPEKVYNRLYKNYKAGNYQETIDDCEKYITRFTGEDIVPKMELLKATVKGRLYGFDAYKKALNYVALTYPQSEEGKRAEEIISESLSDMGSGKFKKRAEGSYNLIYTFSAENEEEAVKLKKTLDKAIVEFEYDQLSTSIDTYTPEDLFLVVHGLQSKMGAEGFGEKLEEEDDYKIERDNFGISSYNYEVLLIHKNLDAYLKKYANK